MFKKTLLATSALLMTSTAFAADVENSNLDIAFQGAHFQGAGNQVTMLRVPVTNKDTGQTQFFDMSAQFAADKNGNLIFKNMSSVKSVAFASANQMRAGHYLDERGKSWCAPVIVISFRSSKISWVRIFCTRSIYIVVAMSNVHSRYSFFTSFSVT